MAQSPKNHAKVRYDVVLEKCINFPLLFKADLPLEAAVCLVRKGVISVPSNRLLFGLQAQYSVSLHHSFFVLADEFCDSIFVYLTPIFYNEYKALIDTWDLRL